MWVSETKMLGVETQNHQPHFFRHPPFHLSKQHNTGAVVNSTGHKTATVYVSTKTPTTFLLPPPLLTLANNTTQKQQSIEQERTVKYITILNP
jgi:hypothetical protein